MWYHHRDDGRTCSARHNHSISSQKCFSAIKTPLKERSLLGSRGGTTSRPSPPTAWICERGGIWSEDASISVALNSSCRGNPGKAGALRQVGDRKLRQINVLRLSCQARVRIEVCGGGRREPILIMPPERWGTRRRRMRREKDEEDAGRCTDGYRAAP